MSIQPYIANVVGYDNVKNFSTWAFGPGYTKLDGAQLAMSWNSLHGNELMVGKGDQHREIQNMVNIWKRNIIEDKEYKR